MAKPEGKMHYCIWIDDAVHARMKALAALRHTTLQKWGEEAIIKALEEVMGHVPTKEEFADRKTGS